MTAAAAAAVESGSGGPPMQHPQQDVFPLGAVVSCQTMRRETVSGEVLCYDHATRLLVLSEFSYAIALVRLLRSVG